jgi:hypothetical protein
MRSYHLAGLLCLLFAIFTTNPTFIYAQVQNMNVNATVLSPINVASLTHLDLGFVLAGGGNQGAVASDPNAGTLSISKSNLNGLTLSVEYPSVLSGPSGATLPLIFNGTEYGSYTPDGGSVVTFNPSSPGSSLTDILQSDSAAVFRFGAMVNPPLGQTVGSYTAQIVLTLSYAAFA